MGIYALFQKIKKVNDMRYSFIVIAILFVAFSEGCAKHNAPTAAKVEKTETKEAPPSGQATTTTDALVGIWKLDKIEIPDMAEKMSAFGNQASKDAMTQTLALYQNSLQGLTVTFNKDGTYQSVYASQSDIGTWTLSAKKEIRAISKVTSNILVYELVAQDATSIKVKFDTSDGNSLWMTFLKK
jgi:hypothetical protein